MSHRAPTRDLGSNAGQVKPQKKIGRPCTVCHHPLAADIDGHIVRRSMTYAAMASKYDVSQDALRRHRNAHLSDERKVEIAHEAKISAAERHAEVVNGERSDIERDMQWVVGEIKALIHRAKGSEDDILALAGLKEVGRALERLAKLYGLLENRVQVEMSIHDSPQFLRLRETILTVLERHPDAKADFLGEMQKLQVMDAPRLANR